jgi:hypothetical protein
VSNREDVSLSFVRLERVADPVPVRVAPEVLDELVLRVEG